MCFTCIKIGHTDLTSFSRRQLSMKSFFNTEEERNLATHFDLLIEIKDEVRRLKVPRDT